MSPPTQFHKLIRFAAVGAVVMAFAALLGALAFHHHGSRRLQSARAGFEHRWGHLTHNELPTEVPDNENGARWLVAGGRAIIGTLEDQKFCGMIANRSTQTWSDVETARVVRILSEQQPALHILIHSGAFETFHLGRNGSKVNHEETDFLSISMGLRLLVLEARLAWSEGRRSDSLAALNAIARAADGLMKTPMVMTSTLGSTAARWSIWMTAEIVGDACSDALILGEVLAILPSQDPVHSNDITMAVSVTEVADEGLDYIEELYDPSVGWSVPFWIPNRFLFEDLIIAGLIERWGRFIELGHQPAAQWPSDVGHSIWRDTAWPKWFAMTGTITPNLLSGRARAQAASTEMQQLRLAFDLRLASPNRLDPNVCELVTDASPTALTGKPLACRYDKNQGTILIEVPGAAETLPRFSTSDNRAARLPPIELALDCERVIP